MNAQAFVTVGPVFLRAPCKRLCSHRRPATSPNFHPRAQADPSPAASPDPHANNVASKSEFYERFNHIRGKPVEPVSATLARFNQSFPRPVPIVYRGVVNEMLTTAHLATVCAMWRSDAIFFYGFDCIFSVFLRYYPDDNERQMLYKSCTSALDFDMEAVKSTASAVANWLDGKTQEDVFAALKAASPGAKADAVGPVIETMAYIRDAGDFDWYYSRLFGIGLIQVMDAVGVELTITNAELWADAVAIEKSKFSSEMATYLSNMERLKQAEQIFAEATAREAKRTAERLATKAEAATKAADKLEKEQQQEQQPATPVVVADQTAEDSTSTPPSS